MKEEKDSVGWLDVFVALLQAIGYAVQFIALGALVYWMVIFLW